MLEGAVLFGVITVTVWFSVLEAVGFNDWLREKMR